MRNDISIKFFKDSYFLPNETYDMWINRMTLDRLSGEEKFRLEIPIEVMTRLHSYIKKGWFQPATPISANLGTDRGLPISCFVREMADSKDEIFKTYNEGFWLGSEGTGIGTYYKLREVGHPIRNGLKGETCGIIPFIALADRASLAISQGGLRRSSEAIYLDISHPEIEEFIDIRKPDREPNRACPNIHHGVIITDDFMRAVESRSSWNLISPKSGEVVKNVDAFELFCKILDVRIRFQGEPYLFFKDTANNYAPKVFKDTNNFINLSNLCTEVMLPTRDDKSNVCCLGSLNLELYEEYKTKLTTEIVPDCLTYLDAILDYFLRNTEGNEAYERARVGIIEDRPLGLGVMGFHSLLQSKHIPFESISSKALNEIIFSAIWDGVKFYEAKNYKNSCETAKKANIKLRNTTHISIAPTMSISMLCNQTSQGIEPLLANHYSRKLKQGTFPIYNKYLDDFIKEYANANDLDSNWVETQWSNIKKNQGSVLDLKWMKDYDKQVFKTAFEIDQRWIIELASNRGKYIDQGQSINLFFPAGSNVKEIYDIHMLAWKKGLKSLYYLRSSAEHRVVHSNERKRINTNECLMCQ